MESREDIQKAFETGVALIKKGHPEDAIPYLEKARSGGYKVSACNSWLGLAIARSRSNLYQAEELCKKAVQKDFFWSQYYINLAEVYLLWGKKSKAIKTLEAGLKIDRNDEDILNELQKLGVRKSPAIPFLSRGNPVNKYIGLTLSKLGFR